MPCTRTSIASATLFLCFCSSHHLSASAGKRQTTTFFGTSSHVRKRPTGHQVTFVRTRMNVRGAPLSLCVLVPPSCPMALSVPAQSLTHRECVAANGFSHIIFSLLAVISMPSSAAPFRVVMARRRRRLTCVGRFRFSSLSPPSNRLHFDHIRQRIRRRPSSQHSGSIHS
ncbi:hypothetical protein OH77DRAFT_652114 [Trametes cingulata]|nr:hypothetical protein OH77DRAFT_652114 [Trametes cingulata]